jgi:8-hydroxy-5-deazaflavin:NADPH oxidoreductase
MMQIGVLGATGPAGQGIAARLASVGHEVIAGSRDAARADATVEELRAKWGSRVAGLRGATNTDAAAAADLVVVATTWEGAVDTTRQHADALGGKTVIAMANGLEKVDREFRPVLPPEGSVAQAQQAAAPDAHVVAAFHLVPAAALGALDQRLTSDVLVVGDDDGARTQVLDLVVTIPNLRAFDGGSLRNAVGLEAFAAVLLTVNVRHRGKASIALTGVEGHPGAAR